MPASALPNALHAVMVTSPIASGRLTGIDASAALSLPGAVAVLTHKDLPKLAQGPVPPVAQSMTPMQGTEIHYEGQPVALVLAETLETAEEGTGLVEVTYSRSDPVVFETGEERPPAPATAVPSRLEERVRRRRKPMATRFRRSIRARAMRRPPSRIAP